MHKLAVGTKMVLTDGHNSSELGTLGKLPLRACCGIIGARNAPAAPTLRFCDDLSSKGRTARKADKSEPWCAEGMASQCLDCLITWTAYEEGSRPPKKAGILYEHCRFACQRKALSYTSRALSTQRKPSSSSS